jgi:thiol-disulfide isomerase/thioredoxin
MGITVANWFSHLLQPLQRLSDPLDFAKRPEAFANGDIAYEIEVSTDPAAGVWTTVTPDVDDGTRISHTLPGDHPPHCSRDPRSLKPVEIEIYSGFVPHPRLNHWAIRPRSFMTIVLTETNFQTEVLDSPLPVLVDFWGEYCAPCKQLSPVLEQLAGDMAG